MKHLGLASLMAEKPEFMARDVAALADTGDAAALQLFADLGRYVGLGLAALVNTLNLPLYIVGGGLASAWRLFAPQMFRTVRHYSYVYRLSEPVDHAVLEQQKTNIMPRDAGPGSRDHWSGDAALLGYVLGSVSLRTLSHPDRSGRPLGRWSVFAASGRRDLSTSPRFGRDD